MTKGGSWGTKREGKAGGGRGGGKMGNRKRRVPGVEGWWTGITKRGERGRGKGGTESKRGDQERKRLGAGAFE